MNFKKVNEFKDYKLVLYLEKLFFFGNKNFFVKCRKKVLIKKELIGIMNL